MGWTHPRYMARKVELYNTAVDLTGSTGAKYTWPCPFDKIKIEKIGFVPVSAFSAYPATMTTLPVVTVKKTTVAGVTAALNSLAVLSPSSAQAAQVRTQVDLDTNTAAAGTNTPIAGPDAYPTAEDGDLIFFDLTTSGVGGTQSVKLYMIYREIEAT